MSSTPGDHAALAARLRAAARAYYDTDTLLMEDSEYDELLEQLRTLIADDPSLAGKYNDLFDTVAGGQSAGGEVEHPTLMGSLDKVVGLDAVRDFVRKIGSPVIVEPKLDGLPIRVVYTNGVLTLAATRGDGRTGEDVTPAVGRLNITGLPTIANAPLSESGIPASFEVRGEVILTDEAFERAQTVRTSLGDKPFKNPRNAAAGILRKGDRAYAGILTFAAYGATFASLFTVTWTHEQVMDAVERSGITTARSLLADRVNTPTTDPEQVAADIAYMGEHRTTLGFPIDGAVIKAATHEGRVNLGEGTRAPKWAMAFKYPPLEVVSTVVAIHETVGKTGRLGLQIEITPVMIDGSLVRFASGHNVGWLLDHDVRIGDTVMMLKRGDVIPYLDRVLVDRRPADSRPWQPPATDPNGGEWDKSTLLWRSTDPTLSIGASIENAVARYALDIEGMGTEIVDALVEQGIVKNIADVFALTVPTLASLPLGEGRVLGSANATKIVAEIDKARNAPWNRVITALSLRMTGRTMSRRLAAAFPTAEALMGATLEDLEAVDGIGKAKARVIRAELDSKAPLLAALADAGVTMSTRTNTDPAQMLADLLPLGFGPQDPYQDVFEAADAILASGFSGHRDALANAIPLGYSDRDEHADVQEAARHLLDAGIVRAESTGPAQPLAGMTIVVSGSVPGYSRTTVAELIDSLGGKASSSVSATTSLLVSDPSSSSKYVKATQLGVRIVTPAEFLAMIG